MKLCDFGWSSDLNDNEWLMTQGGTFAYMSPEAILGKKQTIETDLWSLGILLYELFHLREPFKGKGSKE